MCVSANYSTLYCLEFVPLLFRICLFGTTQLLKDNILKYINPENCLQIKGIALKFNIHKTFEIKKKIINSNNKKSYVLYILFFKKVEEA